MHNCITNNDKIDLDNCKIMYTSYYTMMNLEKKKIFEPHKKQINKEFTKERTLHVWASYTKSEYNYKKAGFEFLDSLAETKEASFIEFVSSRVGWSKVAPLYGFDLVSYVYKKEV